MKRSHLLYNPFKDQVIVHRADSDQVYNAHLDRWLYNAANGGVLVSPFISPREKSVKKEADTIGGRFIQITNRPFEDREKPYGHDFDLCAQGRLLIIAPAAGMPMDRASCLKMNSLAQIISSC